jgi:hypothetical protein
MKTSACLMLACLSLSAWAQTNSTPTVVESTASSVAESNENLKTELPKTVPAPATNDHVRLQLDLPLPKEKRSLLDDFTAMADEEIQSPGATDREQAVILRYFERLDQAGYLTPPSPPPDDLFSRTVTAMFQPEPIRVGHAKVAFSPITAIKRKNPLALLNPIVLNLSW